MKSYLSCLVIAPMLFLASCSALKNPLNIDMKPKQEPMYNFTQSSALLGCVGGLIDATNYGGVDVYISTIPDHTTPPIVSGFLTKDAVMMVTTALGRLGTSKVAIIGKNGGVQGRRQVQVLGAFTELNRTVQSVAFSGEAILPGGVDVGGGRDSNVNHIALDLAMSERNRIIPKTPTSVSVHILGSSGDATITYDDGGDFAVVGAIGYSRQEGFHSASRLLIETSVAIMLSNLYELDIKDCLQKNKKLNPVRQKTPYDEPVYSHGGDYSRSHVERASRFIRRGQSREVTSRQRHYQSNNNTAPSPNEVIVKDIGLDSKDGVQNFLSGAGIVLNKPLVGKNLGGGRSLYSWGVDGAFGQLYRAEQVDKGEFSLSVNKYLKNYIANCNDGGVTSSKKQVSFEQNRLVLYELGCAGSGSQGVVDGVVFFEKDNYFNILSHRSAASNKNAWRFNKMILDSMRRGGTSR